MKPRRTGRRGELLRFNRAPHTPRTASPATSPRTASPLPSCPRHRSPAPWEAGNDTAWGTRRAILHDLVRVAVDGGDPVAPAVVADALAQVPEPFHERWAAVLAPDWHPGLATEFNGAVWPCLGSAVWAVRTTGDFEAALRAAVDLGGDTDTVAAVTGTLAGAAHGLAAVPGRWTAALHVPMPGTPGRVLRHADLVALAARLTGD
ncbi:ADP-ribosylglycohydrolase family protein [Actinacidiphila glaucinigra]|uniref:ADP-ribosylglycohydrolase family protein n=1 Tax=Actinacidiphila glaucinigra TaxID=235986 RepID=UPI00380915C0